MKIIKKIFLTIALTIILSVSAFASSGFQFSYNALMGLGVGIPTKSFKDAGFKSDIGFDGTSLFQFGYMNQIRENFGISYLLELGYNMGSHAFAGKPNIDIEELGISLNLSTAVYYSFDNIYIGLFPKFNFGNFAIGIGGGIKIPMAGEITMSVLGREVTTKLNRDDIVNSFSPPIFGYIKTSISYSFYFIDQIAIDVGLYLGFDIMRDKPSEGEKAEYGYTFDSGIVFGFRFGARVD